MLRLGALLVAIPLLLPAGCEDTAWAMDSSQCGPAKTILDGLKAQFDESPAFTGTYIGGTPAMVTVSPKGTWSVLLAIPPDQLCIMTGGDQWQAVAPAAPSADAPKPAPDNLPVPALLEHGLLRIAF